MIATSVVLLGSVITRLTGFNLDGYMGISVALFIIISGIKLVSDTISPLLGSAPNRELTDYINKKIMGYEHIIGTHDLAVHSYGPSKCFASLHCEVPAEQDIMLSHDIIDNIEHDFLKDGIHLVIHLDPVVTNDEKTNELKKQVIDLLSQISPFIGMHDFRVVWGISHTNLIFDVVVPYDFYLSDEELIEQISHRISLLNKTYLSVITVDHDMTGRKKIQTRLPIFESQALLANLSGKLCKTGFGGIYYLYEPSLYESSQRTHPFPRRETEKFK